MTVEALGLLSEQIQARVVHYRADLETNAELDAITAQVVAQLKAMQAAVSDQPVNSQDRRSIEQEQIRSLNQLLTRVLGPGRASEFVAHQIKPIGRRIAKLFFESELHEKTKGDRERVIRHTEQGVFYVLLRYKNRLRAELENFEFVDAEIRQASLDLLAKIERDLQMGFLSRRSPELNRVMNVFTAVLTDFFEQILPPELPTIAQNVIKQAGAARLPNSVGYKVPAEAFPEFRKVWEKELVARLVGFAGEELVTRLSESADGYHDETVRFFTDPHVFSQTAEVVCDKIYDFLCQEGYLDLPLDWRVELGTQQE